ncbi:tyrosine-type recombinase/integrase [Pseudoteredinibacter isoporae]|uniref:tyrosine-type recombinase/integrase n=1 Tax=Pseudoteredinibacter isoporae TaxID=570281 RepID=UPI003109B5AB
MTNRLILLPGMDGSGQLFDSFVSQLRQLKPTVMALPQSGPQSYEHLATIISDQLPSEPYYLLAESFSGGIVAQLNKEALSNCKAIIFVASFLQSPCPTEETSKSQKTRHIPLSPTAIDVLNKWRKQAPTRGGRVFPADDGGKLDNVRKSWATILKLAEITRFRWHDMRHDFASKLVMKGVPLNTVRELCGHSDLNTTLRYAHLAPDHKADAIALIG